MNIDTKKAIRDKSATTLKPVRAIKKAANHSLVRIMNALDEVGVRYSRGAPRRTSIDRLLGGLPRPTLERVLTRLEGV